MNFCIECGAKLEGTRFCTSCGAPIEAFGAPAAPPQPPHPPSQPSSAVNGPPAGYGPPDIPATAGPNTAALAYGPPLVGGPYGQPTTGPLVGPAAGPPAGVAYPPYPPPDAAYPPPDAAYPPPGSAYPPTGGPGSGGPGSGGPPTALVAAIAFVLIAALAAAGTVLVLNWRDATTQASPTATTSGGQSQDATGGQGGVAPSARPSTGSSPSAGASGSKTSATAPDDVVLLTAAQATAQLEQMASRDAPAVADLAGEWVPQVSSKCQGLSVNLNSDYTPGGPRVDSVSTQQILGLHLAMGSRHSALTTTAGSLGVKSRPPTTCVGKTMWMVLVPQTYPTSAAALAWCQSNGFPRTECGARYVVAPGRSGTQFVN